VNQVFGFTRADALEEKAIIPSQSLRESGLWFQIKSTGKKLDVHVCRNPFVNQVFGFGHLQGGGGEMMTSSRNPFVNQVFGFIHSKNSQKERQ